MDSTGSVELTYEIISVACGGRGLTLPGAMPARIYDNTENLVSPCQAYQSLFESSDSELLIYIHDDVTIHDPEWLSRVLALFTTPEIAVVGLGGAPSLGHPDLYKRPYRMSDMARGGYMSNQTDWAVHGLHETTQHRVAVVEAFFMAIRRDLLVRSGGWPTKHLTHHCIDLWVCCEAARQGRQVWMVGAECTHHGGGSSIGEKYKAASWLQGGSLHGDHTRPHRWLYEEYRDVLPLKV